MIPKSQRLNPYCILLADRPLSSDAAAAASIKRKDPVADALRLGEALTSRERLFAVVSDSDRQPPALQVVVRDNLIVQPRHRGTAFEILLALLAIEAQAEQGVPVIFVPTDHVVSDQSTMARSLVEMGLWVQSEPDRVYLLGAAPEGPHDELGYIIPWYDARETPAAVYEFVERPDARRARQLINAGGLWNTFIFSGTIQSLLGLFRPRFDKAISAIRPAMKWGPANPSYAKLLAVVYERLEAVDFSQDVLSARVEGLRVLRVPNCGWWPLKSPLRGRPAHTRPI
jgi:mannose-1-phosphate guanylyltransferase